MGIDLDKEGRELAGSLEVKGERSVFPGTEERFPEERLREILAHCHIFLRDGVLCDFVHRSPHRSRHHGLLFDGIIGRRGIQHNVAALCHPQTTPQIIIILGADPSADSIDPYVGSGLLPWGNDFPHIRGNALRSLVENGDDGLNAGLRLHPDAVLASRKRLILKGFEGQGKIEGMADAAHLTADIVPFPIPEPEQLKTHGIRP